MSWRPVEGIRRTSFERVTPKRSCPALPRTAQSPGARSVPPPGHFSTAAAARKAVGHGHEQHWSRPFRPHTEVTVLSFRPQQRRPAQGPQPHRTVLHRPPTGALIRGGAGRGRRGARGRRVWQGRRRPPGTHRPKLYSTLGCPFMYGVIHIGLCMILMYLLLNI